MSMTIQPFKPADTISKQIGVRMRQLGILLDLPSTSAPTNAYQINIIGCEGASVSSGKLVPNADAPDLFNDTLVILACQKDGTTKCLATFACTTEPGRYFTLNPLNPSGAARLAIDYKHERCWGLGYHKRQPTETLVQKGFVRVLRDANKDGKRTGDKTFTGLFGINFHAGNNSMTIGQWSAGCVVISDPREHSRAMSIIKSGLPLSANRKTLCNFVLLDSTKLPAA